MTLIQRLQFRWNQPSNEGKRIVVAVLVNLASIAACLWILWQAVQIIVS